MKPETLLSILKRLCPAASVAVMLCMTGAAMTHAASAVVSGIDIMGSEKGCALTLTADAPFSMAVQQKGPGKNGMTAVVSVRCSQAIYGLDDFSFTEFPAACPVRRIAASESPASGSFELLIGLTIVPDRQIQSRQKGSKWIILLSREPSAAFAWNAAPVVAKPPAPAQDNGQSRLIDVTLLARDRVERITFQFDRPTVMRLKRETDRIVVLFVNATSDLASQRLTLPGTPQVSHIDLKQVAHGGTMWLGASLFLKKESAQGALLQAFSDRLVIFCTTDSLSRLSAWSAKTGPVMSFPFIRIPQFDVDYKSMEAKAKNDLASTVNGSSTFAIKDVERQPEKAAPGQERQPPAALPQESFVKKEPLIVRYIVARNNVNLRAGPSSSDSILCRLQIGTAASLIAKQDGWMKIRTDAASGWVSSGMVVDSGRAPRELLDKAEQARTRQLEKPAAEEKAALLTARKEKLAEEQRLQKQRLQEELAAKKQAERDARDARDAREKLALEQKAQKQAQQELAAKTAAARDSVMRYTAAQQDSQESAKRYHGPKLVEYHVFGRDPFLPLSRDQDSPVPYVEDLNLVGILYDQVDRIGLCEDKQDKTRAYALRENDPVQNGYVLRVQPDKVLFLINELGISRTYALKLIKEKQ